MRCRAKFTHWFEKPFLVALADKSDQRIPVTRNQVFFNFADRPACRKFRFFLLRWRSSKGEVEDASLSKQCRHDAQPFSIQRLPASGLSRPTIPIFCIALIAFFAMQVGVNPRTFDTFVLLSGFVRRLPIAFGIPPEPGERGRESGRRFGCVEKLAKVV